MAKLMVTGLVASMLFLAQPAHAAHFNPNHTAANLNHTSIPGPLGLGEFVVNCCGNSTAVAQFATQPYKGTGVQLQVTQPTSCTGAFAETGITNINGVQLKKRIHFSMSGLNDGPVPVANVSVNVSWTDPHGKNATGIFTVANGGLTASAQNTEFTIFTGAGVGKIAPGSILNEVDFELAGNNVQSTQTAFIENVEVDRRPVYLDFNTATASCMGGS